ncbi:MAG: hypothetical protein IJ200_03300 [Prevotella sp.]|nr:hypothetical protein [Prevotella sp.]
MKKTYSNPEMEIIKVSYQAKMLAGSDGHVDVDDVSPINSGDDIGARGFDFDDEE